jgi:2-polyprenyl-3-methyl-5-hydroxy-6-metoxy-1,4-benzoquinol methylase
MNGILGASLAQYSNISTVVILVFMAAYDTYIDWKDWSDEAFLTYNQDQKYQFEKEFGLDIKNRSRILEIGFGNGTILGILKDLGKTVSGVEINHSLVERAKHAGISAYHDVKEIRNEKFDCIIAFDVLEHIPLEELTSFLSTVRNLLTDDGVFIARFPNGESPFALPTQYGDTTHVTSLGWNRISQLAQASRMKVIEYRGEKTHSRFLITKVIRLIISCSRNLFADVVLRLFYPRMPRGQVTFRYINIIAILGYLPE